MTPARHPATSPAEQERLEERAAILEYEAGWPRVIAESEARRALAHDRWQSQAAPPSGWIQPPT